MSSFVLKIFAIISMLIDHASFAFYGKFSPWNYLGRLAFPIFAYQISEGYIHTSNLRKYFLRLLVFALISQIPFSLFLSMYSDNFYLNIFFTLLLGLLAITVYDKLNGVDCKDNKLRHRIYQCVRYFVCLVFCCFV